MIIKNFWDNIVEIDLFACTFCFPNTDHVMILRRFDPLSCSSKRAYSCLHLFFIMNKTKDQIFWVSSHDLYWENKMYKRKRSIVGSWFHSLLLYCVHFYCTVHIFIDVEKILSTATCYFLCLLLYIECYSFLQFDNWKLKTLNWYVDS